jgi:hypothetical protein
MGTRPILKKTTDVYELVDNNRPQKIIIIVDGSIKKELAKIREYIFAFFEQHDICLDKKDIIAFQDPVTNNLEILINGIYVENYKNKEIFIRKLLQYIEVKERDVGFSFELDKIKTWKPSEIDGAEMYRIPQRKHNLDSTKLDHLPEYITNIQNCRLLDGSITIIINNNINGNNNKNNISVGTHVVTNSPTVVDVNDTNDIIQEFATYIKNNKPKWYTPNKWMFTNTLYEHFIETMDTDMTKNTFSKNGIDILFSKRGDKYIDSVKGRSLLLLPYNKL